MMAVADIARVPVAAVYFGMVPTPFPKPWAWFTPMRADGWTKGTSKPTTVEKTLLPSRYTKGPQPKPGEQPSDVGPVQKTPVSSVRLPKIVQANRRVGMVDRQLDQSKSRSTRGTRR